jgi:hypothetical protein
MSRVWSTATSRVACACAGVRPRVMIRSRRTTRGSRSPNCWALSFSNSKSIRSAMGWTSIRPRTTSDDFSRGVREWSVITLRGRSLPRWLSKGSSDPCGTATAERAQSRLPGCTCVFKTVPAAFGGPGWRMSTSGPRRAWEAYWVILAEASPNYLRLECRTAGRALARIPGPRLVPAGPAAHDELRTGRGQPARVAIAGPGARRRHVVHLGSNSLRSNSGCWCRAH